MGLFSRRKKKEEAKTSVEKSYQSTNQPVETKTTDEPASNDTGFTDEVKARCEQIISKMTAHDMTVIECAADMDISKTTVHKYIHTYIQKYYPDDYAKICEGIEKHKHGQRN